MRDLPRGPALLAAARQTLIDELLPLLPAERRLDARLVANCMAIAAREAEAGAGPEAAAGRALAGFYESAAGDDLARRFARDLRIGAFENSAPRAAAARAMLWRMTIDRLRLANPRYLAANGFAEPPP